MVEATKTLVNLLCEPWHGGQHVGGVVGDAEPGGGASQSRNATNNLVNVASNVCPSVPTFSTSASNQNLPHLEVLVHPVHGHAKIRILASGSPVVGGKGDSLAFGERLGQLLVHCSLAVVVQQRQFVSGKKSRKKIVSFAIFRI